MMHRPFLPGHGLRIAVAALVSLTVAPAAGADDGVPIVVNPVVMAASLVDVSLAGLPALPLGGTLPAAPPPTTVPEAVAAAAEPIQAQEPQPTPPPPQPQVPDPEITPEELAPPPEPQPAPVEQPQYQPDPPQYQPPEEVAPPEAATPPAPTPAEPTEEDWTWNWKWSCGGSDAPAQLPAVEGDGLPDTWNWNWTWNCDPNQTSDANSEQKLGTQYQPVIAQYHPVNVNVSIRVGSPGNDGPVTQTNVVVVVEAQPVVATAETPASAQTAPPAPPAEPAAAAAPASSAPAAAAELPAEHTSGAGRKAEPKTTLASAHQFVAPAEASSWNARPVTPRRLQPTNQEAHRNRPQLRRPTRRPLPPTRAPMIPVSSAGAAPLGGSDGGGFQLALLLVPFALALVDSARRLVRDTAPPVGRGHKKRRKRPG